MSRQYLVVIKVYEQRTFRFTVDADTPEQAQQRAVDTPLADADDEEDYVMTRAKVLSVTERS